MLIMNKIAIYGAGGFGREVKMLIDQINMIGNMNLLGILMMGFQKGQY